MSHLAEAALLVKRDSISSSGCLTGSELALPLAPMNSLHSDLSLLSRSSLGHSLLSSKSDPEIPDSSRSPSLTELESSEASSLSRTRTTMEPGGVLAQRMEVGASVAVYVVCSISMVLLNKLVTSPQKHGFNFPMMLIFFQNFAATVTIVLAKAVGVVDYPGLTWKYVQKWIPLTFIFTGMLVTSLMSLRTMSVAIVTLIKAFAVICTAIGDHILFEHPLTRLMVLSFVLMYAGSCLGGGSDAWVTAEGLLFSVLNVVFTSGYQLYMKGLLNDVQKVLGRWGPVFYNNLLSLPILVGPTLATMHGDGGWLVALNTADWWAKVWICAMCLLSPFMTMSTFWCISATSPTTYSVVGGMNKIPLSFLGMALFNQWPNVAGFVGIVVGVSGGFVYIWARQRTKCDSTVTKAGLVKVTILILLVTVAAFCIMHALGPVQTPTVQVILYRMFSKELPQ
eukprot:Hpha_TRINITY_DN15170_c3_g13::TRINITY_DN15170_c3_g13_i1::g.129086::m.129086/K15356/VRG4, GONST1; GDP-mannose transporter